jgi:VCBS repeat-containing protein
MSRSRSAAARRAGYQRRFRLGLEALEARRVFAAPDALADGFTTVAIPVGLQNATAFHSQGGFEINKIIDGNLGTGWANDALANNVAVFETVNTIGDGQTILNFSMTSGGFGTHELGKFRISVTSDNRSTFADGVQENGDVTATWTPVTVLSVKTTGTSTFTINADGSVLAGGSPQESETYSIRTFSSVPNITGIRLEAIEDPSLPVAGPGRGSNGNYVVQEFSMTAERGVVPLQNATSQATQGGFNVSFLIDGVTDPGLNSAQSWANDQGGTTPANAAVFETRANLNPSGSQTLLTFNVVSGYFTNHHLGAFRISYTTDDRTTFADGLNGGGDVTANWTTLTPLSASSNGPTTVFTIAPDNRIIATGAPLVNQLETYTVRALTSAANITGFRIEALEDPALPDNPNQPGGPGRAANGNFVMYEFSVNETNGFAFVPAVGPSTLNVLANDSDSDPGDTLTIQSVNTAGVTGSVTNNGNNLTYTPPASFQTLPVGQVGIDTFTYTIKDSTNLTSTATVLVLASRVPTAVSDTVGVAASVPLQNATALFSQSGFSLAAVIDGIDNPATNSTASWANAAGANPDDSHPNTAVFETVTNVNPLGADGELVFRITSGDFAHHELGKFRLSVTSDDRSTFADGLSLNGDVTATWTVLTPLSITTTGTSTFTINADKSILAGGSPQERETYTIRAATNLANITGFRLEALEDVSLPKQPEAGLNGGPGRGAPNGNYVMQEFAVAFASPLGTTEGASFSGGGLLTNDVNIDGPAPLTISPAGNRTSALGAAVTVNANGTFTYDPAAAAGLQSLGVGQTATDTFTYTVTDGVGISTAATVSVLIAGENDVPTATAGGPYTITELQSLQLNASVADIDGNAVLTIDWDLDNDGQFDDASTANPLVTWAALGAMTNPIRDQAANLPIKVRVSDGIAPPVIASGTLTVTNRAPTVVITGDASGVTAQPLDFLFTTTDAAADVTAGFTLDIDWDGGGVDETITGATAAQAATHVFNAPGTFVVSVTARDKDNGVTSPAATFTVTVGNVGESGGVLTIGGSDNNERMVLGMGPGGLQVRINNRLVGTFGNSSQVMIFAGGGDDTITIATNVGALFTIDGGEGNDYIAGGRLGDTLIGGPGNDRLLGGGGADFIYGGDGNDAISGGIGNDTLDGEEGNDQINGEGGDDSLFGGAGNDKLGGGVGRDLLRGGDDGDTLDGGDGSDVMTGDAGSDRLYGRAGLDVLIGGESMDIIYGGTGDDLMLGSLSSLDAEVDLRDLLVAWNAGGTLASRIALLTSTVDATEDDAGDNLYGEAGNDWFLMFLNDFIPSASDRVPGNVLTKLFV